MSPDDLVQALIAALGYRGMRGYFQVDDLPRVARYRHVIGEAFRDLRSSAYSASVDKPGDKETEYIPLVYVAKARNR